METACSDPASASAMLRNSLHFRFNSMSTGVAKLHPARSVERGRLFQRSTAQNQPSDHTWVFITNILESIDISDHLSSLRVRLVGERAQVEQPYYDEGARAGAASCTLDMAPKLFLKDTKQYAALNVLSLNGRHLDLLSATPQPLKSLVRYPAWID